MRKILHPGLGKCGTTSKQLHYWPKVCRSINWNFISKGKKEDKGLDKNVYEWFLDVTQKKNNIKKISEFKKNIFFSDEGLLENRDFWDPENYEKSLNYIYLNFDKDYEIILTLRKPSDWLISNYLQYVTDGGNLKIDQYYLNNEEYKKSKQTNKFNLEKFNYKNLILNFKKKYKKVYILFYELENFFLYKKIFFNEKSIKYFSDESKIEKKSISYISYILLFNLNKFRIFRKNKLIKYFIRKLDKYFFQYFFEFPKKRFINKIKFDVDKLDEDYLKLVAGDGFEPPTFRL